jgi:hypothetical protein
MLRHRLQRFVFRLTSIVAVAALSSACDSPATPSPPPTNQPAPSPSPAPPPAPTADVTVSGVVRETAPTQARVVPGAAITASGSSRTETTVADGNGRFTVSLPPGQIQLSVGAPRFDQATSTLDAQGDLTIDLALRHTFRIIAEHWESTASEPVGQRLTFQLPVHYSGMIRYSAGFCGTGCGASEFEHNCAELRDQTGRVLHRNTRGLYDNGVSGTVSVEGGQNYELSVWHCSGIHVGTVIRWYWVDVERPI